MSNQSSGCASFLKAMFVILGILTILSVIGGFFAWRWWSTHKNEVINSAQNLQKEGNEAGRKTDEQGCLDLSIGRIKKSGGFTGSVSASVFLNFCLQTSGLSSDFCKGVPADRDLIESATWRIARCSQVDVDKNDCQNLFGSVQRYCNSGQREKKTVPAPSSGE